MILNAVKTLGINVSEPIGNRDRKAFDLLFGKMQLDNPDLIFRIFQVGRESQRMEFREEVEKDLLHLKRLLIASSVDLKIFKESVGS